MKKQFLTVCILAALFVGCGSQETIEPVTEHVHAYVETITKDATCEADGEKTLTCECGDTYSEVVPTPGHVFENYVSNEDATYLADGTETATCNGCELTDTRTAEGSKLEYTYTELDKTMYAKQSVNVRNLPSEDGEKLGGLSFAQEIKVTGQCNETNWYRIEFEESVAYVNNDYLQDEKPEETANKSSSEMSRNASDYRQITDLSQLTPAAGWDVDYKGFVDNYKNIEKVAYTYNGVTILLYDYTWSDQFGTEVVVYDFTSSRTPWARMYTTSFYNMVNAGGFSTTSYQLDGTGITTFHPISNFQVY